MTGIATAAAPLAGHLILLAEGETFGPSRTEDLLCAAGARVLLACTSYQAVLVAGQNALTAAILDAHLGAHAIAQICDYLDLQAVPVLVLASSAHVDDAGWQHVPIVCPPADALALADAFAGSLARVLNRPRRQ